MRMGEEEKNCRIICDLSYKWKENPRSLEATKIHHIWILTHVSLKTLLFCLHDFMCLKKKKIFLTQALQCKYPGKYQHELCGRWRDVRDRRANGSLCDSPLLSAGLCRGASSKLGEEKGQRSIHAVTGNPLRCHGLPDDSHEASMCHWLLWDVEDNRPLFSFNIYLHNYLNVKHWQMFPKKW